MGTCKWGQTWMNMILHNYTQGVEQMRIVRWTCTHLLMYVNIPKQGVGQDKDDWNMNAGPHKGAHVCMQLLKGVGVDIRCHADTQKCSEALTILNKVWV